MIQPKTRKGKQLQQKQLNKNMLNINYNADTIWLGNTARIGQGSTGKWFVSMNFDNKLWILGPSGWHCNEPFHDMFDTREDAVTELRKARRAHEKTMVSQLAFGKCGIPEEYQMALKSVLVQLGFNNGLHWDWWYNTETELSLPKG